MLVGAVIKMNTLYHRRDNRTNHRTDNRTNHGIMILYYSTSTNVLL
jgi:hypothetical protein